MSASKILSTRVRAGRNPQLVLDQAEICVTAGPERGMKIDLGSDSILIGSGAACDLVLHDGTVSQRHAEIQATARGYFIRDLGSTNGIVCNGLAIDRAPLQDGMSLALGESTLSVRALGKTFAVPLSQPGRLGGLVALSMKMRAFVEMLTRVAASDATVLIEGETGTGKELAAQTLHTASARRGGPFVVFDCGAINASLVAAELFGYEKGAFTGAHEPHPGLLESAEGGTLFLDEIGELRSDVQPLLLGVLERKRSRRVGGRKETPHDVRIVAATNRNLAEEVRAGRFRQDLFYRLAIARMRMPPLRERPEDLVVLAELFASEARAPLRTELLKPFLDYDWPGNVRELRNTVIRLVIQPEAAAEAPSPKKMAALPGIYDAQGDFHPWLEARRLATANLERDYFAELLGHTNGNITKAAEIAGVSRQAVSVVANRWSLVQRRGPTT